MKDIMVIGKSIQEAKAIAENIAEERGEEVTRRMSGTLETTVAKYCCVGAFVDPKSLRGCRMDEVLIVGDIPAQKFKALEELTRLYMKEAPLGKVQMYEMNEDNTHFFTPSK